MNANMFYVHFNALLGYIGTESIRRGEMKDESPFRRTLAGYVHTLASGLRFRGYL